MSTTLPLAPSGKAETLDDIMLAMDVVDTLRHEREMTASDLNAVERREDLIARLRNIYKAQGITVPDDVLMDGVIALEEERFAFQPPKKGIMTSLARIYISRRKWLPLIYTISFIIGSVLAVNYAGFVRPAQIKAKNAQTLISTVLPDRLDAARERAIAAAKTEALKTQAEDIFAQGELALSRQDAAAAQEKAERLEALALSLTQSYALRIVSRHGEASGVYLDSETNADIRNFYLIVEALDTEGQVLSLPIEDEVYKSTKHVNKFGVRVPKAVFDKVAADKKDDQIIQNDILGAKPRGVLTPTLDFDGAKDWPLGFIVEW
jgi:hypothetical protein